MLVAAGMVRTMTAAVASHRGSRTRKWISSASWRPWLVRANPRIDKATLAIARRTNRVRCTHHRPDHRNRGMAEAARLQVPVTVVHSRGFATRAVRQRINKWFEAQAKDGNPPGVLVATHTALLDLPPPMYADRYHLVFDEVPDVTAFSLRQLPRRSRWFTWLLDTQDYRPGVLRIVPGSKRGDELDRLLTIARNHPHDEGDALFEDWAAAVLDPDRYVLVAANRWYDMTLSYSARQFGGEIDMLTVLHPSRFRWWKTLTIAGARPAAA